MADKTLKKVEESNESQRITDNQGNGTGHGEEGNSRNSTSLKSSSKGSRSAGGSTGGSRNN